MMIKHFRAYPEFKETLCGLFVPVTPGDVFLTDMCESFVRVGISVNFVECDACVLMEMHVASTVGPDHCAPIYVKR